VSRRCVSPRRAPASRDRRQIGGGGRRCIPLSLCSQRMLASSRSASLEAPIGRAGIGRIIRPSSSLPSLRLAARGSRGPR
jgi:hypothetical protein